MKKQFILARCADFNGHKDVLFMMESNDFRLTDPRFSANYTVLDPAPQYDRKHRKLTTATRGVYAVHSDYSVTMISAPAAYYDALRDANEMMIQADGLEPTSALKQAASDRGIQYGPDMGQFVKWANNQWGI